MVGIAMIIVHVYLVQLSTFQGSSQMKRYGNSEMKNYLRLFTSEEANNRKKVFAFLLRINNVSSHYKYTQHNQY